VDIALRAMLAGFPSSHLLGGGFRWGCSVDIALRAMLAWNAIAFAR